MTVLIIASCREEGVVFEFESRSVDLFFTFWFIRFCVAGSVRT